MMISSVNVSTNLFQKGEVKDNVCYRFSRQKYNWKLPHLKSLFKGWGIALWQDTIFTESMEWNLWNIKSSRSAVFLKIHLCENKRKRTLVGFPSIFSNFFLWATRRRRAMERSWQLHSIYPIMAAGCYLPQSWNLSKLTMLNGKMNFKTCVVQNIPWTSHKLLNFKLIFKNCRIKACFDAWVFHLLSFKPVSPFFNVCTVCLYTLL